jgi:hypothetical protein
MKYIFVRQIKSGSTSLTTYLNRAFGNKRCFQGNSSPFMEEQVNNFDYMDLLCDIERLRMIQGHLFLPPDFELDDRYRVISVIRHPVDRLISWYYYNKGKASRGYRPVDCSLIDFARELDGWYPHLKVDQLRRLSATLSMSQIQRALKSGQLIACTTDQLNDLYVVLRSEIPACDTDYHCVTEAFPPMMPTENRGHYDPAPLEVRQLLEKHLDREFLLYHTVKEHFKTQHIEAKVHHDFS